MHRRLSILNLGDWQKLQDVEGSGEVFRDFGRDGRG